MQICGANSAGVSILEAEAEQFRWFVPTGILSIFEGRDHAAAMSARSGVCLDAGGPVLMARPERGLRLDQGTPASPVPEVSAGASDGQGVEPDRHALDRRGTLRIIFDKRPRPHHDRACRIRRHRAADDPDRKRVSRTHCSSSKTLTKEMDHRVKKPVRHYRQHGPA